MKESKFVQIKGHALFKGVDCLIVWCLYCLLNQNKYTTMTRLFESKSVNDNPCVLLQKIAKYQFENLLQHHFCVYNAYIKRNGIMLSSKRRF